MNTKELLAAAGPSMLIIEERETTDIVIGVPHHAPAGTTKLPCPEHEVSDENTEGLLAGMPKLNEISINGDFDLIPGGLRASQTATINDSRWLAYHLELAPKLRRPRTKTGEPPAIGLTFCDKLADVLQDVAGTATTS